MVCGDDSERWTLGFGAVFGRLDGADDAVGKEEGAEI